MPRSNGGSRAGEVLSDIKARLGFSQADDSRTGDFDDFGEYDDFDEGYNARDDREYAGYGADYDEGAPADGYRPATTRSGRFGRPDSTPDLVSIDDVKARAQAAGSPRDPLSPGSGAEGRASRRVNGRDLIESPGPAQSSPAYNAARERDERSRSEGLDSLFEPTGDSPMRLSAGSSADAYRSRAAQPAASTRGLTVVRPIAYADAERVSQVLKRGDVVVLAMRNTPADLFKRILDFSFGAASALDASVECPADKVFAIARGRALDDEEKRQLRNQGVL